MASSVEADSSKPTVPQDASELPAADAQTEGAETEAQPSAAPAAELDKGGQPDAAAAPTSAEGATQEDPPLSLTGGATPDTPAATGRGTGKRGRGAARGGQRGGSRGRGSAKRAKQEHPDTDPEDDRANTEGGLQTRRSSRQSKKPKTFAEEFIAELDPESHMGVPGGSPGRETAEAAGEEKEPQPAAQEPSQDSDEMPLMKAVQTAPDEAEAPAEAADTDQPQEAKTPRTYARQRKKAQEAAEEGAPEHPAEKAKPEAEAEAHAEEAKSPRARRGKSQEAGHTGSDAGAPEAEGSAPVHPVEPRSPKAKRKRQADAEQPGGQEDGPDLAAGAEGKQAAQKRRRAKTAPAQGKAGKGTAARGRRAKSREATPVEADAGRAGPDQTAGQQRAAGGASGQQAPPAKTGPVSELEHIREGLQKAEEAHERKLGELRHLDAQVKGYMEHLSRMDLTIEQLSRTGIGKTVRRFNRWPTQRELSVRSSQESASDPAKALVLKWHNVAGVSHPKAAKPAAASVPSRTGEAKQKQTAQPEEAPKEKAAAQPVRALPAQAAQQPQAPPHPVSEAPQAAAAAAAPPVKKEEPKVVSIGFKQEMPAPVRKPQPSKTDANHSTGSAVRDKALGILLHALTPDEALSREEAAKRLEAALYASCTNGKTAGPSGQPAEPGVTYMRRLKVLWSWLDGSSPYRSPGLKLLFIEGKLAAPELATIDARRVRDLTEPPASSTTPHPGSQQDADGTLAGTAPGSAEGPYASEGVQQSMDMDLDPPSQGLAVPGLPGQGIAVSALPSQELLAKLQLFCEGSLPAPQPTSGHLQGFTEPPLEQTVREIVQHQEAALRACQAGEASAEQLHGIIAASRLLERSLGTASRPAAAQQQAPPLLPPAEAQLQLLPFAQAALAAHARTSAAPGQPAPSPGSASLRTPLPPQAAAAVHANADAALQGPVSAMTAQPVDQGSAPGQSQDGAVPNGGTGVSQEGGALDLAAAVPTSPLRTPVLGGTMHSSVEPVAAPANPDSSMADGNHFANMHSGPGVRQGWRSEERPVPSVAFGHSAKHMHGELAGVLHAQQLNRVSEDAHNTADNGAVSTHVDANQQAEC